MQFIKLDENHDGKNTFMYGEVTGEIIRKGITLHVRIALGSGELNFMCEDADEFLSVCSELLMQDMKWNQQITEEKEPF